MLHRIEYDYSKEEIDNDFSVDQNSFILQCRAELDSNDKVEQNRIRLYCSVAYFSEEHNRFTLQSTVDQNRIRL